MLIHFERYVSHVVSSKVLVLYYTFFYIFVNCVYADLFCMVLCQHMHRLVIVEDDKPIQFLYKAKLELEGFHVATADNGEDGLEVIKAHDPALILLDIRMPIMSGDEMLARLREQQWGASIRVIILTNISRDEAPSALRFLNVDRYLVKAHHTPAQVVDVVNEVLGRR